MKSETEFYKEKHGLSDSFQFGTGQKQRAEALFFLCARVWSYLNNSYF